MSRPTRMGGKAGRAVGDKTGMLTRRPSAATLVAIIVTLAIGTQASLTAQAAPSQTTSSTRSRDYRAPLPVRVVGVTDADASSVAVAWSRSRDNVGVAGYGVYLDGARRATTPETRYALQALACGTGYIVGVDAFDAAGNKSSRTSTTVSTDACADLAPPSAPIGMQRLAATETSVVLAWTPSDDDVGVVEYGLFVSGLRVGTVTEASATVSNLECGKTYSLGIDAADAAGNRSTRSDAFFATAACVDKTPPVGAGRPRRDRRHTDRRSRSSGTPSTDNVGVTGYGRYVATSRIGTSTTTNASFGSLKCGTTYTLGVDATDAAGNRSSASTMTAATDPCSQTPPPTTGDMTTPTAPQSLSVSSATQTAVTIGWGSASDNVGVVNYRVYRNGTKIGEGPGVHGGFTNAWADSGRACGTSYQYAVEAQDAAGNTGPKATVTASTAACTGTPPPATQTPPPARLRRLRRRPRRLRRRPRRLRRRPRRLRRRPRRLRRRPRRLRRRPRRLRRRPRRLRRRPRVTRPPPTAPTEPDSVLGHAKRDHHRLGARQRQRRSRQLPHLPQRQHDRRGARLRRRLHQRSGPTPVAPAEPATSTPSRPRTPPATPAPRPPSPPRPHRARSWTRPLPRHPRTSPRRRAQERASRSRGRRRPTTSASSATGSTGAARVSRRRRERPGSSAASRAARTTRSASTPATPRAIGPSRPS